MLAALKPRLILVACASSLVLGACSSSLAPSSSLAHQPDPTTHTDTSSIGPRIPCDNTLQTVDHLPPCPR